MVTINAHLEAKKAMAKAIENWLESVDDTIYYIASYESEELVARGQVIPIAEEI